MENRRLEWLTADITRIKIGEPTTVKYVHNGEGFENEMTVARKRINAIEERAPSDARAYFVLNYDVNGLESNLVEVQVQYYR